MDYVTRAGLRIQVGRIDRRLLDAIVIPEPQPPVRSVETWGGLAEEVPVYDDPAYLRSLRQHRVKLWRENLTVIAKALVFTLPTGRGEIDALRAIGLGDNTPADYLRFKVGSDDQDALIELVYYLSTVTVRGVAEAEARFAYTWRGKPLNTWGIGYSHGQRGQLGVDYRAAVRSGLTWLQFCQLTGPEQSEAVAFWNLEDKLSWLVQNENHRS